MASLDDLYAELAMAGDAPDQCLETVRSFVSEGVSLAADDLKGLLALESLKSDQAALVEVCVPALAPAITMAEFKAVLAEPGVDIIGVQREIVLKAFRERKTPAPEQPSEDQAAAGTNALVVAAQPVAANSVADATAVEFADRYESVAEVEELLLREKRWYAGTGPDFETDTAYHLHPWRFAKDVNDNGVMAFRIRGAPELWSCEEDAAAPGGFSVCISWETYEKCGKEAGKKARFAMQAPGSFPVMICTESTEDKFKGWSIVMETDAPLPPSLVSAQNTAGLWCSFQAAMPLWCELDLRLPIGENQIRDVGMYFCLFYLCIPMPAEHYRMRTPGTNDFGYRANFTSNNHSECAHGIVSCKLGHCFIPENPRQLIPATDLNGKWRFCLAPWCLGLSEIKAVDENSYHEKGWTSCSVCCCHPEVFEKTVSRTNNWNEFTDRRIYISPNCAVNVNSFGLLGCGWKRNA